MKKSLILCSFILTTMWIQAQGKWQIIVNKKTLIATSEINDSLNTRIIKSSVWKSGGYLEVNYTEASPSNWIKSLHFIDEVNNELIKRENTTHTKIKISTLRKLYAGKKTLRIYMSIDPPNPMMMAPSKMITLCILKLP